MKPVLRFALALFLVGAMLLPSLPPLPVAAEAPSSLEATDSEAIPPAQLTEEQKNALLAALYEADIATLREAIALRLITCRELTEYYLQRIEDYNKPFNCFITLCDNALEEADRRDEAIANGTASGSLFGIPIVVKDNIDYVGYHTTNGYKKNDEQIAKTSATIVENLLAEGAIILAKTNMSKAAQEARISRSSAVGETKNAYNTLLASGGSSGGSAVATSLNFAAGSLGTDTNSSLRYPAALNGCVSLRPTFGLLDREGLVLLNTKRDTAGAITRTVLDQAILLDALIGGGSYTANLNAERLKGLRIGVLKELSGPITSLSDRQPSMVDQEILDAFDRAISELRACGAEVVTVSMSKVFTMSNACKETKSGSTKAKATFYAAFETLLADNGLAAVIFPTYLHTPQWTGVTDEGALRVYEQPYINNISILSPPTGLPEISVPIGTHSRGAGISMEIASLKNSEQLLLDIAYSYTSQFDHRVAPEGAPNTYAEYRTGDLKAFITAYQDSLTETESESEPDTTVPDTTTLPDTEEEPAGTTEPSDEPSAPRQDKRNDVILLTVLIVITVILLILCLYRFYPRGPGGRRRRRRRLFRLPRA